MENRTIRNIAKKTLSLTGKALLYFMEKSDDFMFELQYPSLCYLMGNEGARRFLDNKYGRFPPPIRRLKQNGWVTTKLIGDKILITLTESGKVAGLQLKIARQRSRLPGNKILLLIFDIPESSKLLRQFFRESLKRMGFERIQLSVWGTNKEVAVDLVKYLKLLKMGNWVSIYFSKKVA